MISSYEVILKRKLSYKKLLNDLKKLTFKQQLTLVRQKFQPILQEVFDLFVLIVCGFFWHFINFTCVL